MQRQISDSVEVLLVEDNPADVYLTEEALESSKLPLNVNVVGDGEEAMTYLQRRGRYEEATLPDLVLLDLNLPRKSGGEVLTEIRADAAIAHLPVIVLTTSEDEGDVLASYRKGANCFVTKPVDLDDFMTAVGSIEDFWLTVATLPPRLL